MHNSSLSVADEYLETQILTSPPARLHLLVVEGSLRFARRAGQALRVRDFETAHDSLNRARDCVNELLTGLNPDTQPELMDQLKALFLFVHRNLVAADLQRDPTAVDNAIRILEIHRDTWQELLDKLSGEAAAPQATLPAPHIRPQLYCEDDEPRIDLAG